MSPTVGLFREVGTGLKALFRSLECHQIHALKRPVAIFQTVSEKLFGNSEWVPNGAPKAAKRGRRSPDRPPRAAKEALSRRLQLFSKQFRRVFSPKFVGVVYNVRAPKECSRSRRQSCPAARTP